jgi:lipoxygenase homology domain-containing protein 1
LTSLTNNRVGHDNSGFGPAWFLDKVVITNTRTNQTWFFLCGRWFAKNEDDGQIIREIPASDKDGVSSASLTNYKVTVFTGDRKGAGTDANVHVILFGENGDSGKRKLESPSRNLFGEDLYFF